MKATVKVYTEMLGREMTLLLSHWLISALKKARKQCALKNSVF